MSLQEPTIKGKYKLKKSGNKQKYNYKSLFSQSHYEEENETMLLKNEYENETSLLVLPDDETYNETILLNVNYRDTPKRMKFMTAAHSDAGIYKKRNEDSFCLKVANTSIGEAVLLVVCDGMGGLQKGELASATIIRAMSDWFENRLPQIISKGYENSKIIEEWKTIIKEQNKIINEYGKNHRLQLGTTLTGLLIANEDFIIVHVGDSRVYRINSKIEQITEDQTVVQEDINLGLITKEEGRKDSRQNILLQCIGASEVVAPEFTEGKVSAGEKYLLCSDGLIHKINEEEMYEALAENLMTSESVMEKSLIDLIELNKARQEKDNITVMLVKVI